MLYKSIDDVLKRCEELIDSGLDGSKTLEIFELLGLPAVPADFFTRGKVHTEFASKIKDLPYDEGKRCLHIVWDALNISVYSGIESFAIPLRQAIAKKMFKKCGKNFSALYGVRFFFPQNLEVGDNVLLHRFTFIDAGAGVKMGNNTALAENSKIYTHEHDEADLNIEIHRPVELKDGAQVFADSTVMYGVTVGENSIIGTGSLVTKDVPANVVVAGRPAKVLRERRVEMDPNYEYGFFKEVTK